MATLNMSGPHPLNSSSVSAHVLTAGSPGNYALGRRDGDGTFIVQYVGRSDACVRTRLTQWCDGKHAAFKYSYASSPKAAFERECINYHDFGGSNSLENAVHPDRPAGSGWRCPRCSIFT